MSRVLSLAGFEVTLIGRFWVIPEVYENFLHPEVILFGLDLDVMHQLINDAAKRIRQGYKYAEGHRYDDLLESYQCEFRKIDANHRIGLVNYATWYYRSSPFPVLQLVWRDLAG
jgi:hypothetical protein